MPPWIGIRSKTLSDEINLRAVRTLDLFVSTLLEATGETFSEHLREHRLQTALRMLRSPRHRDWRVVEIAFAAGFGDLSYFNRTFRRRFGDTPQAFRARSPAKD